LIQVFVETLDKCFENVCELDLIFHADNVHFILNELVMGGEIMRGIFTLFDKITTSDILGMVLQTNMNEILARIEDQNKIQKSEAGISATATASMKAVSAMKNINLNGVRDKVLDLPSSLRDFKF
jgi:AP-3 complex subunit sigma